MKPNPWGILFALALAAASFAIAAGAPAEAEDARHGSSNAERCAEADARRILGHDAVGDEAPCP